MAARAERAYVDDVSVWMSIGMAIGALAALVYVGTARLKARQVARGHAARGWAIVALGGLVAAIAFYGATAFGGEPATLGYLGGALLVAGAALALGRSHRGEGDPGP